MKSKIKKRIEVRAWIGWSKGKSLRSRSDLQIDLDFSNSTLKHFEQFSSITSVRHLDPTNKILQHS